MTTIEQLGEAASNFNPQGDKAASNFNPQGDKFLRILS